MPTILKAPSPPVDQARDARDGIESTVAEIIAAVRDRGIDAVRGYSLLLDGWDPDSFRPSTPAILISTSAALGRREVDRQLDLPTAGAARYTGGLWVGKFLKTVTYQECTPEASVEIAEICARQSRVENFEAHARSCDIRVRRFS